MTYDICRLLVRLIAGPACDLFGPRKVFAGTLLLGCVPLGLAPLVRDAQGLYVSRFFIGILGASFVPCQVWSTGFFDKNVVGTANALTGGWGNAGGGVTYFVMPAVLDSLVARGYTAGVAWRLAFVVPLVVTLATGVAMLLLCPDTPTGRWSERHLRAEDNLKAHGITESPATDRSSSVVVVVDVPGRTTDEAIPEGVQAPGAGVPGEKRPQTDDHNTTTTAHSRDHEAALSRAEMLSAARGEVVARPTWGAGLRAMASPQSVFLCAAYACSFGGELAINSVLGAYFADGFPALGQTRAAYWAAMFGFLNVVTRPLGGVVSDLLYRHYSHHHRSSPRSSSSSSSSSSSTTRPHPHLLHLHNRGLWAKKAWVVACGCAAGALLLVVGRPSSSPSSSSHQDQSLATAVSLVTLVGVFLDAGNGANFALVPHVHPRANGIVSGAAGAAGNLGGVVFAVVFRFAGGYARAFRIIGAVTLGLNLCLCWVRPVPRGQVGGR